MKSIAIVGAGSMGKGIAYICALNGFDVYLNDINIQILEEAKCYIKNELNKSEKKGYIGKKAARKAMNNLTISTDLSFCVKEVDLVIEAVLEEMNLKIKVFKELDELCNSKTIFATNTSTMSPTEIGAQTGRPDKVIAMHFFNPVHKMKLIEIVKGLNTSEETIQLIQEVGLNLGKETVEISEFPGFVTSRMNCLIGNEAMNMLMEGVASAIDIDKAIKLGLNHPMGPLELADLVGLDTRLRNLEYLYNTLGEKYRPSPLLRKYVNAGKLGKKTKVGIYNYN